MSFASKHQEFESLKGQIERIEQKLDRAEADSSRFWTPKTYFWIYHVLSGVMLGVAGAAVALLANVMLAPMFGKHPLELIRVFLTFPLGAQALALADSPGSAPAIRDGMILTFGCLLYLVTGMLLGMPTHTAIARLAPNQTFGKRLVVGCSAALIVWLVLFYGVLTWLQPMLFGGNWITSGQYLPWWVAAVTHAIFGGTMALLDPLTQYLPLPPAETWDELATAPYEEPPLGPGG